jgi:hypothetical protein
MRTEALVLLAIRTVGGIFSTVVSIASLITYPALLAPGVPPLSANMTNTVTSTHRVGFLSGGCVCQLSRCGRRLSDDEAGACCRSCAGGSTGRSGCAGQ